jgi:chromodomain-helicase-DNA-binding protein 1
MSLSNGHSSDIDENHLRPSPQLARSESELSDLNDLPTNTNVSLTPQEDVDPSDDDAIHDMATSELDEDDDAEGEEDAEFSEQSPAPEAVDGMRHDRLSSEDSLRPSKRKADVDDDEYMKQNPELYGLRRSVRANRAASTRLADALLQGRARPSRRVVRAPSSYTCDAVADSILPADGHIR